MPLPRTSAHEPDFDETADQDHLDSWLVLAAEQGKTSEMKTLLALGAHIDGGKYDRPLNRAARNGQLKAVQLLFAHGADLNSIETNSPIPGRGISSLSAAIHRPEVFRFLLAAGADIEIRDNEGNSTLCRAVKSAESWAVEMLCNAGADVDSHTATGLGAIHFAAAKGDEASLRTLLAHGAKTTPLSDLGHSALYLAALHCIDDTCLEILWRAGARLSHTEMSELHLHDSKARNTEFGLSWLTARLLSESETMEISASAQHAPELHPSMPTGRRI